jgi:predicted nucleotidyltransferase
VALLGRQELLQALEELDQELAILNVQGEVFIVGGAAMAIAYDTRRATADVDAVFVPSREVLVAASRVAEKLDLEPDWLNDGAKTATSSCAARVASRRASLRRSSCEPT